MRYKITLYFHYQNPEKTGLFSVSYVAEKKNFRDAFGAGMLLKDNVHPDERLRDITVAELKEPEY